MNDPAAAAPTTTPPETGDEVCAAHQQLCRALVQRSTAALEDLLDETYTAVHLTGQVSPRAEWLGQIASGEFTYHSITEDRTDVEVHGQRATTTSTARYDVTLGGRSGRYRLRSTLEWVERDGRWRAVRGVATPA